MRARATRSSAMVSARWVLRAIGANVSETILTKSSHQLITHGPYRWIRHPLYTTGVLLFTALGLIAANWFVLAFALIALLSIRFVVVPMEERELIGRFGTGRSSPPISSASRSSLPWGTWRVIGSRSMSAPCGRARCGGACSFTAGSTMRRYLR